jgi:hypothetical protein
MATEHYTLRITDQRSAQIAALEKITGLRGPAAVIDHALATTLAQHNRRDTMKAKRDPRILDRANVSPYNVREGYMVDLSEGPTANPDCYWPVRTLAMARRFLHLVDSGVPAEQAHDEIYGA